MYVDRIELRNVRTFASDEVTFIHPETDFDAARDESGKTPRLRNVNLLLGDNGSGKTTVLRAIAASCFGPAARDVLRDGSLIRFGTEHALITTSLRLHAQDCPEAGNGLLALSIERRGERLKVEDEWARAEDDSQMSRADYESVWAPVFQSDNDAFFVVGYGATRRVERLDTYDSGARTKARAARDLRIQSLFEDAFSLIPLASWLPRLRDKEKDRFEEVKHILNDLLKPTGLSFIGDQDDRGDYFYWRGDMPVPFQSLSDGYRAFIGWVADLLYHLWSGCRPGRALHEMQGIVLVDEIDLHLHPAWQQKVVESVARAFPKMQFILTSHSPLIAASLERVNVTRIKLGRQNRSTVKRLEQSIYGLDSDQILLSELFGLKSTRAPAKRRQLDELTVKARGGDDAAAKELVRQLAIGMEDAE